VQRECCASHSGAVSLQHIGGFAGIAHVQSAAAQDVDRGSWLGPPRDCNSLFVATVRPRPVSPWAAIAPPADGHLTASPSGRQSFFLERRFAAAESGRGRTFCFVGGHCRQAPVRQRGQKD